MIPCAPYIKSMCQSFRPLLPGSQETTPQGSPVRKDSAVRVSDVKGSSSVVDVIESFNDNVSVYVPDQSEPSVRSTEVADVAKTLATFKPESPDVTRAAKRFEKARRSEERIEVVEEGEVVSTQLCDIVEDVKKEKEEEKVEKEEKERDERRAEEEKRGARSKTTER